MRLALVFACVLGVAMPSVVAAQTSAAPPRTGPSFIYGISAGLGSRMMSGTFLSTQLPLGAGQPPSSLATGSIDLVGGIGVGRRVALLAIYEGGASLGDSQGWGTLAAHAAIRAWLASRVWVEGGGGIAELAFRPSAAVIPTRPTTRWWQPGVEAAAGYDLFRGPTVSMDLLVRYSEASFEGVRQQSVSVQFGLLGR